MTKPKSISKRQFLHALSIVLGSATAAQLLDRSGFSSALAYQSLSKHSNTDTSSFTKIQLEQFKAICDAVLPKTNTPSASELGVHHFLVSQLSAVYDISDQNKIIQLLSAINNESKQQFNLNYTELAIKEQQQILINIEVKNGFNLDQKSSFKLLKSLIVFGYFTTEIGATQVLKYQAVPGGFKGSIPYKSVGTAWGSHGFY